MFDSFSGPKDGDFNQRGLKLTDVVGGEYPTTSGGSLHLCTFSSRINSVSTFLPCICILPCRSCTTWAGVTLLSSCMFCCRSFEIQAARCKMHVHLAHVLLQELQDAVGTTVGAGVNLTGQLTRAAVPVAQGIVGAVREVVVRWKPVKLRWYGSPTNIHLGKLKLFLIRFCKFFFFGKLAYQIAIFFLQIFVPNQLFEEIMGGPIEPINLLSIWWS